MQCMEKPAARKTTDGTDPKQAEKNRSISHIYYTSLYNIGRKIAICISKNEANLRKIQMKMLAHLRGASVKNTKKTVKMPCESRPWTIAARKKPYPFRKNRYGLAGTGGMPQGRAPHRSSNIRRTTAAASSSITSRCLSSALLR